MEGNQTHLAGIVFLSIFSRSRFLPKKLFKDMWKKSEEWNQLNFKGMNETELISLISEMRKKYAEFAPSYMILASSASLSF